MVLIQEHIDPLPQRDQNTMMEAGMCKIKTMIESKNNPKDGDQMFGAGIQELPSRASKFGPGGLPAHLKQAEKENYDDTRDNPSEPSKSASALDGLSIEDCVDYIKKSYLSAGADPSGHQQVVKQIRKLYEPSYQKWKAYLMNDLNLCIYGIGSKVDLLENFVETMFPDSLRLKIKGYNSAVKVENIMMKLANLLEPFGGTKSRAELSKLVSLKRPDLNSMIKILEDHIGRFNRFGFDLVITFHDIDGKQFRQLQQHQLFAKLVHLCKIKLVASISYCTFTGLLDKETFRLYNFAFDEVNTHLPNEFELVSDEVAWYNKQQTKSTAALKVIYDALTEMQKDVIRILAEEISKNPAGQVSFEDFFEECQNQLVANSRGELDEMLKEAIAHNVGWNHLGAHRQEV